MKKNWNRVHGNSCTYIGKSYFVKILCRGICSNETNDPVRDKLESLFGPLSKAYMKICKTQQREFFGLRDFYRYSYVVT